MLPPQKSGIGFVGQGWAPCFCLWMGGYLLTNNLFFYVQFTIASRDWPPTYWRLVSSAAHEKRVDIVSVFCDYNSRYDIMGLGGCPGASKTTYGFKRTNVGPICYRETPETNHPRGWSGAGVGVAMLRGEAFLDSLVPRFRGYRCLGFLVSWFIGFSVSGFLFFARFLVSWFPNFLVSTFIGSWFQSCSFSQFLGFEVCWLLDFKVSWFQIFEVSEFQRFSDPILPNVHFMFSGRCWSRIQDWQDCSMQIFIISVFVISKSFKTVSNTSTFIKMNIPTTKTNLDFLGLFWSVLVSQI